MPIPMANPSRSLVLAALLGIKLMPRMRTWNDVTFYRVDRRHTYTAHRPPC